MQKCTPFFPFITQSIKVCMVRKVKERRNNRWWLVTVLACAATLAYTYQWPTHTSLEFWHTLWPK